MGFGGGGGSKTKIESKPYPRTAEGAKLLQGYIALAGLGKIPQEWAQDPYVQTYLQETGDTAIISPLRAIIEWRRAVEPYRQLLEKQAEQYAPFIPAAVETAREAFGLPPLVLNWGGLKVPIYPFRTRELALRQLGSVFGQQAGLLGGAARIGEEYMRQFYAPFINTAVNMELARLRVPGTQVTTQSRGGSFLGNLLGIVGNVLTLGSLGNVFGGNPAVINNLAPYQYSPFRMLV